MLKDGGVRKQAEEAGDQWKAAQAWRMRRAPLHFKEEKMAE